MTSATSGHILRVRLTTHDYSTETSKTLVTELARSEFDVQDASYFNDALETAVEDLDPDEANIRRWSMDGPRRIEFALRRRGHALDDESEYQVPYWAWGVSEEGHLKCSDASGVLIGDLVRSMEAGYTDLDWFDVEIWECEGGRGGDSVEFDFISFLLSHGIDIAIGGASWLGVQASKWGLRIRRSRLSDRKARLIVFRWKLNGIQSPWHLRQWFDSKDRWFPAEVAMRLRISELAALDWLKALGYERVTGDTHWVRSSSPRALRKRAKWLRSETTEGLTYDDY